MFKRDLEVDLEGDLEVDLEGDLEEDLEGDSKGDFRGDFKQDLEGDLMSRTGPSQVYSMFGSVYSSNLELDSEVGRLVFVSFSFRRSAC